MSSLFGTSYWYLSSITTFTDTLRPALPLALLEECDTALHFAAAVVVDASYIHMQQEINFQLEWVG